MRASSKLASVAAGLLLAASAALATAPAQAGTGHGARPAAVGSGNQWAYKTSPWGLLNAWDAGPWVRNYYGGSPTSTNDDFTRITLSPSVNQALMFSGLGDWAGKCIGDAFND